MSTDQKPVEPQSIVERVSAWREGRGPITMPDDLDDLLKWAVLCDSEIAALKERLMVRWSHTCVHHNDKEREEVETHCHVCKEAELQSIYRKRDQLEAECAALREALIVRASHFQCPICGHDLWDDNSAEEHDEECPHYATEKSIFSDTPRTAGRELLERVKLAEEKLQSRSPASPESSATPFDFAPLKGPFRYEQGTDSIVDCMGNTVLKFWAQEFIIGHHVAELMNRSAGHKKEGEV